MTASTDSRMAAVASAGVASDRTRDLRAHRRRRFGLGGLVGSAIITVIAFLAILAPAIARHDPLHQEVSRRLEAPSREHPLGTDRLGRDLAARVLHGSRVSLITGTLVVIVAVSLGLVLGLLSGYYGGAIDFAIQRGVDVVMAFPGILLAIGIMAFIGQGLGNLILAIAIVNVPRITRIARGSVLQVRTLEFVEAARASGARDAYLLVRHIVPSILGPVIVQATFTLVYAIRTESTLNFLGLGVAPPAPSWGGLLDDGKAYLQAAPWMVAMPATAIALTILALSLVGDALRDYLDPRHARRFRTGERE